MKAEHVPSDDVPNLWDIARAADRGILPYKQPSDCSDQGQFTKKLISLMEVVMRRNSSPHWTEELRDFYKLAEEYNGQKNIQQGGSGTIS